MKKSWESKSFGTLLKAIKGGGTPSKNKPEFWNGNIPWCSVKDMADDKFRISKTEDNISKLGLKNSSSNLIPKGTVITSTRMGLGRAFINEVDMAINQDLKAVIPNEQLENKFLLWLIIFNRSKIESLGTGSTVKGIRLETLKALEVSLPPLPTQRKIAAILSAYDDLIENNLKRIKLLEEKAQLTYEEWFVRMKFPGHESTPINEETGLPEGWERKTIGDIIEVGRGSSPRPIADQKYFENGSIPWLKIADATASNIFIYETKQHVNEYGASFSRKLPIGSIVVAASGTLGFPMILGVEACIHDGWLYFKGIEDELKEYFYFSFIGLRKYFESISYGAAIQNINTDIVRNSPFLLPDRSTVKAFKKISNNIFSSIDSLQKQNHLLKEARDILLPRLMTGMIEVDALDLSAFEQEDQEEMLMAAEERAKYNND